MSLALIDPFSIATGYEILKVAKREGWLRRPIDFFRPKTRILLLGSTGTGKSQFLKSVPEIVSQPISHAARTEFPTVARFELNDRLFDFVDTPGQLEHRPRREEVIRDAIRKKNLGGVINFVSYGYHEYGASSSTAVKDGMARPEYLAEHREREIALLGEWAHLLSTEWIMTVITKADIWWDEKDSVGSYYQTGPYKERLHQLFPNAHSVTRPYSSVSMRFYGTQPGSRSFDDSARSLFRTELFRLLREAADQKKRT